jgi:Domain of unknown function (DUF4150)/GHH signature containing HNH/Endo VII superfamily nuclease toxin  2
MANEVYANENEVACKAAAGKSICAFPDVCMTPPENPATPPGVPVPYPNTGLASDTTDGSRTVEISGKEVMLKNKSYFKTSYGDEAGCAAKKGVLTSTNRGKIYFIAWSMDVKIEGENADRHFDMTTHNHASPTANEAVPTVYKDRMVLIQVPGCEKERKKINDECGNPLDEKKKCPDHTAVETAKKAHKEAVALPKEPDEQREAREAAKAAAQEKLNREHELYELEVQSNECAKALRCALVPYNKGKKACCPHQTPDHLVPASQFGEGPGDRPHERLAPCMCATGNAQTATHGLLGRARTSHMIEKGFPVGQEKPVTSSKPPHETWTVQKSCECGAASAAKVTGCSPECLQAQLEKGHKDMGIDMQEELRTTKEDDPTSGKNLDVLQELMDSFRLQLPTPT